MSFLSVCKLSLLLLGCTLHPNFLSLTFKNNFLFAVVVVWLWYFARRCEPEQYSDRQKVRSEARLKWWNWWLWQFCADSRPLKCCSTVVTRLSIKWLPGPIVHVLPWRRCWMIIGKLRMNKKSAMASRGSLGNFPGNLASEKIFINFWPNFVIPMTKCRT